MEDIVRKLGFLSLGSRLKRFAERLQADTQLIIDRSGQTIQANQYPLLAALDMFGPLTVGDLAQAMGVSQPGTTKMVSKLVGDGLIEIKHTPNDQRKKLLALSLNGQRITDDAKRDVWPRIQAAVQDLCDIDAAPLLDVLAQIEDDLADLPLSQRPRTRGAGDVS